MKKYVDVSNDRQKEVFSWLKESKHARPFKNGDGFYVISGVLVKLKNGEIIELMAWIKREGFDVIKRIYDYHILHKPAWDNYSEQISFFEIKTKIDIKNEYHEHERSEFDRSCDPDPMWSEHSSFEDSYYLARSSVYNDYYDHDLDRWVSPSEDDYDDDD